MSLVQLANKITAVDNQEDKKDLQLEEKSSLLEQVIEIKKSVDNILSLLSVTIFNPILTESISSPVFCGGAQVPILIL